MSTRIETDSMGSIEVPEERLWGAQTQRALQHFNIGWQRLPWLFVEQYVVLKKACALANGRLGKLSQERVDAIAQACDAVLAGRYQEEFVMSLWHSGSGTQFNMNINEVIANLANEALGAPRGSKEPLHPNDHVNRSQSTNDTFPSAMHMSTVEALERSLKPALQGLRESLQKFAEAHQAQIKVGRTHMMDATPLTVAQEFGAYVSQLECVQEQLAAVSPQLMELAIGGTAVGTGLNTSERWAPTVIECLVQLSGRPYQVSRNHCAALAGREALCACHGVLKTLASTLFKIANDIRLMASGPRCGLAELHLPDNEPGSSIMPGKVNPTQVEALTQICLRVMGNDTSVGIANSQGQFQLNVYNPLLIYCVLESITLLADGMQSFTRYCIQDMQVNAQRMSYYLSQSLMLVTALNPVIGYDAAAQAAKYAWQHECSLEDAVVALKLMSREDYRAAVQPAKMTHPSKS